MQRVTTCCDLTLRGDVKQTIKVPSFLSYRGENIRQNHLFEQVKHLADYNTTDKGRDLIIF